MINKPIVFSIQGCIFRAFKKFSFKDKFDYNNIYPTTHDAVLSILHKNQLDLKSIIKQRRKSTVKTAQLDDPVKSMYVRRKYSNIYDDITGIKVEEVNESFSDLDTIQI